MISGFFVGKGEGEKGIKGQISSRGIEPLHCPYQRHILPLNYELYTVVFILFFNLAEGPSPSKARLFFLKKKKDK